MSALPNTLVAITFLQNRQPDGPWLITAISPDGGKIEGQTFASIIDAGAWINQRQGKLNLYYTVNPLKHAVAIKANKADIAALTWLHVDIDPRTGEDRDRERIRILAALGAITPSPTVIVDSGGGYQAFWKLGVPMNINSESDIAVAESYNLHLAEVLGGDKCHSIDHLMRLPGTINVPGEKKKQRGRVEALATVVKAEWTLTYPLSSFSQVKKPAGEPRHTLPEGEHTLLESLDELNKWGCPAWLRQLIETGEREGQENRYPSRSEALFAVVSTLHRHGVPADVIVGIQVDTRFKISESVLEKPKPMAYARHQIESAIAKTITPTTVDEVVEYLNRHYFAIQEGGKVAFYREDGLELEPLRQDTFEFELKPNFLLIPQEKGTPKRVAYSTLWIYSSNRRYYSKGFVLEPHSEVSEGYYNLWKGFYLEARKGDWSLMQRHILEVLAKGNVEHATYITKWAAWAVQNPSTPARVALVFKGGEGVGKGIFCNALVKLFGAHGLRIHNMTHLVGRFNAHLRLCCLLFADEAVAPNSQDEGTLKGLITEPTIPIERKGYDMVDSPNRLHVAMATNNEWAVPSGTDARRFAVFRVADTYYKNSAYFDALAAERDNGGLASMLYDLLNMDLKGWHPESARPETQELAKQKALSLKGVEAFWFDCLKTGYLPATARKVSKEGFLIPTKDFTDEAADAYPTTAVTMNKTATFLGEKMGFEKHRESRPSGYLVPTLAQARQQWDARMFKADWDLSEKWDIDDTQPF